MQAEERHDSAADVKKSFATTEGGRIAYVESGRGEPIVLIHGMPTSAFLWRNVAPRLAGHFRVYAVDLLGFGDSDKPQNADLSIAAQAKYLRGFMAHVGWEKGAVAGHDIGGGIAQLLAVEHPELVRKLILLDTIAYDSWPIPEIERLKEPAWHEIIERIDLRKGFREALERGTHDNERVDDELVSRYVAPFQGLEGRRAYLRCARALRTQDLLSVMERVEQLEIPTLVVWGETDDYQPLAYGRRLAERMRRAQLVVLPEAGHFVQEDKPEEVASVIEDFVRSDA